MVGVCVVIPASTLVDFLGQNVAEDRQVSVEKLFWMNRGMLGRGNRTSRMAGFSSEIALGYQAV